MTIILDLARLLEEGKITQDEYERFQRITYKGRTDVIFSNIFLGMGIISGSPLISLIPGSFLMTGILGLWLFRCSQQWFLLGGICIAQASFFALHLLWRAVFG